MGKARKKKTTTSGAIHRVPCPWCKKPNDCRGLTAKGVAGGWGGYGLEPGTKLDCDHCGNLMEIAAVQDITVVTVKKG
jgi:hypothetical protein